MTAPKTALITGASSGLGRGLAAHYARAGVTVYAAGRRLEQLESLKAEVGANLVSLKLDVADADACFERVQALDRECGGLDLVIANAGVGEQSNGKRIDWNSVHQTVKVNVAGAAATLCGALPAMAERKRGHLVGVSSLAAFLSLPRTAAYAASKAFLTSFMESLRFDVEPSGVAVTVIHPGFVKTEMTARNKFKMPFLLESEEAVRLMAGAIDRREKFFSFPWQMSGVVSMATALPRPLYRAIAQRTR